MRFFVIFLLLIPTVFGLCVDHDDGVDVSTKSKILLGDTIGTIQKQHVHEDSCLDAVSVLEWYCSDAQALSTIVRCAYGCLDGVCQPPPRIAACNDGLDGDGDGYTDFPYDPGCACAADTDEQDIVDNGEVDCAGQEPDACVDTEDRFPFLSSPDTDLDGLPDDCDNCPFVANIEQRDEDVDGIGDACEERCTDECFPESFPLCSSGTTLMTCVEQEDGCTDIVRETCDCKNRKCK